MTPVRTREERRRTVLVLAAMVLGFALLYWLEARRIHVWTQDEEYYVQLARLLSENFPGAVWDLPVQPFDERGIQRFTILLLAFPLSVVNGETGILIARALQCLSFASVVVPAYLLARGVRLSVRWSYGAAVAVVVVPWATVTGAFLTETLAYPAALWAIWGAWRACVVPGWRTDAGAVLLVVLAGLCRTNLLALAVVAPVATTLHALAGTRGAGGFVPRVRATAVRLWQDSPLFAVLLVPGAILFALNLAGIRPGPLASLSGGYVSTLELLDFGPIPEKWAGQVSRIVIGIGILPAMLALPWMLRQAFRRTSPETGALALCGLAGFAILLFSTVYAAPEERYLMLAAPFFVIPAIAAIARDDVPVWAIGATAVVFAVLVGRVDWSYSDDVTRFITDPVQTTWARMVETRLSDAGSSTPGGVLVLLLGAALVGLVLWRRRAATVLPLVALLAAVAVVQLAQTGYAVRKHTELAAGPGGPADWAWVDERLGDEPVGLFMSGVGNSGLMDYTWRDLELYNRHIEEQVVSGEVFMSVPRYGKAYTFEVDDATGRIVTSGGEALPRHLVVPTSFPAIGLAADPVERSTFQPLELVRLRGEPRATYRWTGTEDDGWLSAAKPTARLRVYPAAREGGGDTCLTVKLTSGGGTDVEHRYRLRLGGVTRTGTVPGAGEATVSVPIRTGRETGTLRATTTVPAPDGRELSVNLGETSVGPCP